jgi:hypothetical protein
MAKKQNENMIKKQKVERVESTKFSNEEHGILNPAATSKKLLNKMDKIWDW